jgi:transketolase
MWTDDALHGIGRSEREEFGLALVDLASTFPKLLVLDGDLANSTRADIFAVAQPSRFLQLGIAEQNMIGVAAGLATQGFLPVVTTFACFAVYRALDQVRVLVAQPRLNVKIVGGYSGLLTGVTGKTHQAIDDLAIMRGIPGMVVIAPADDLETRAALGAALRHDGPVYLRLTRDPGPRIRQAAAEFEIGRAVQLHQGRDVTVFATGQQTARVLQAANVLRSRGIEALVVHLPTMKPLDVEAIVRSSRATGLVVTSEEHQTTGGLGGAVSEVLGEHSPLPILRLGIRDVWGESASNDDLLEKHGLAARPTAEAIEDFVRRHQSLNKHPRARV